MKKKRKTTKPQAKQNVASTNTQIDTDTQIGRRKFLRYAVNGAIGLAVLGGIGVLSVNSVRATIAEQDLTQLGIGRPTVVQIHDPQCSLCTALQREARKALKNFEKGEIDFLVANINTEKGAAFAARYGVPHVTLLLFDASGKLVQTLRGPQDRDFLKGVFKDLVAAHG